MGKESTSTHRLGWIDSIRGIAVISMVLYHLSWDLVYMLEVHWPWFGSIGAYIWQQSICWTFIFISGFCWSLGHHQLKRGLQVFLCGVLVRTVTQIFMPDQKILFGILTLLVSCMLLQILLDKLWSKCNALVGAIVAFIIFLVLSL